MDGREVESTTRHLYDRRGRLVRSVTVRESLWTEMDRAEVLALALFRATRCPCGCGHDIRETTAADGKYVWRARKRRCLAREAITVAQTNHKTSTPEAVLWAVERVGER